MLLVGCAGRGLAVEFGETLKLRHCALTYVDGADMPRWGQLGCQGSIVLDGAGAVVCKTTPAFLEVEDLAFGFVESSRFSIAMNSSSVPPAPSRARASSRA